MSLFASPTMPSIQPYRRLVWAALLTVVALTCVSMVYYFAYRDGCTEVASWKFCKFSRHLFERSLGVFILTGIYFASRPALFTRLTRAGGESRVPPLALGLALSGALCIVTPLQIWGGAPVGADMLYSVTIWAVGVAFLAAATMRIAAPFAVWGSTFLAAGPAFWGLIVLGLFLPEIGDTLFPLWHQTAIKDMTFAAVVNLGPVFGLTLSADPSVYLLGGANFWVEVGQSCSGIEGLALITVFIAGYIGMFWKTLHPLRVVAVLPLLLGLSLALNVVRITILLWIGFNVSPVLAVEGFHSHAGWLMFSILALGSVATINGIGWFRRDGAAMQAVNAPLAPFFEDWNVARLVPFGVFMFTALLASTFFEYPALAYPFRFAAMLAALWLFRAPLLAALPRQVSVAAIIAGALVGVAWLVTAPMVPDATLAAALANYGPVALFFWIACRMLGTTFLVPLIEELFFRSYLLERLGAGPSLARTCFAVAISTMIFGALHDRWLAAGLAGLVFAVLALRRGGGLTDALVAHAIANGMIATWALAEGNWSLI